MVATDSTSEPGDLISADTGDASLGRNYDPLHSPVLDNPFPFYRKLRNNQPVCYSPMLNAWLVSRYSDVQAILQDPERFSSVGAIPNASKDSPPEVRAILARGLRFGKVSVDADPPQHAILRAIDNWALSGPRINAFRPSIMLLAHSLIDKFIDHRRADLVEQFADQYAGNVIAAALGVAPEDFAKVRSWSDDVLLVSTPGLPVALRCAAATRYVAYQEYVLNLIEDRRRSPQNDIMSDLTHRDDIPGAPIALDDLVRFFTGTYFAAVHTTRNVVSSTLLSILADRDHWERACAEPQTIPALVEEALRRDAPHRGLFRTTTKEVEIGGVSLPPKSRLYLLFGSANRDEAIFENPDVFVPGRANIRDHLAFGTGIHRCAGAHLARTEARLALMILAYRIPGMVLAADYTPSYQAQFLFYGLDRLMVTW